MGLLRNTKERIAGIGVDKFAHFGIGGLVAAVVAITAMLASSDGMAWVDASCAVVLGSAVTLVASVAKEAADDRLGSPFDWKDIGAAMLGCLCVAFAVAVGLAL